MKKFLVVLTLLASFQYLSANNDYKDVEKLLLKALKASQNEKKSIKTETWINLAEAYVAVYDAQIGNAVRGVNKTDFQMAFKGVPISTEEITLNGDKYTKCVYNNKNLYFNSKGNLEAVEILKPILSDALPKALNAYRKAYDVDVKRSKDKEISIGLKALSEKFSDAAYSAYTLGDMRMAESLFEFAFDTAAQSPYEKVDTSSAYNLALVAWNHCDYVKAKDWFDKCLDYGYYREGEVFAKMSDCISYVDTTMTGRDKIRLYLEEGLSKFPKSEILMFSLINYYMADSNGSDRLFELIKQAKSSCPDNAMLDYVEGLAYKRIGDFDKAANCFDDSSAKNSDLVYPYFGKGQMFYEIALDLSEKARNELDDAKYMLLVQNFEVTLKKSIDPFEQAYLVCEDQDLKLTIAEYLKQIYYRFRDMNAMYLAGYEKYNAIIEGK